MPLTGPIPSHLFGNMWSQDWNKLYPILKPATGASSYDLSTVLAGRNTSVKEMSAYAERFYTWRKLRAQYMGMKRPAPIDSSGFDAGAKGRA